MYVCQATPWKPSLPHMYWMFILGIIGYEGDGDAVAPWFSRMDVSVTERCHQLRVGTKRESIK